VPRPSDASDGRPGEQVLDNFAKLFRTMFTGSMYGAGLHVFATWAWVLTHKDEQGLAEVNPRLVAAELGAEVEQIERAIEYLTSPDPASRSPEEEGRRLVRVGQFIYRVVNHAKYRERGGDRTAYWREYRAKKRATVAQHPAQVAQHEITHAEANANANAEVNNTCSLQTAAEGSSQGAPSACSYREALRSAFGVNRTLSDLALWFEGAYLIDLPPVEKAHAIARMVTLIERSKSEGKTPVKWFMGAVKRPQAKGGFGYLSERLGGRRSSACISRTAGTTGP